MFRSLKFKPGFLALHLAFIAITTSCSQQPNPATSEATTAADVASAPVVESAPSVVAPTQSSVKTYIDPVTGAVRAPTQAEIAADAAEQKRNSTAKAQGTGAPREFIHPDGTIELTTGRPRREALVGCIDERGEVKMDHECKQATDKGKQQ